MINDDQERVSEPMKRLDNGDLYEGQWNMANMIDGFGQMIYADGSAYKGHWK